MPLLAMGYPYGTACCHLGSIAPISYQMCQSVVSVGPPTLTKRAFGATIDSRVIRAREIDHHVIRIIYAAKILAGELAVEVNGSTDACEWIPLDRVADHPLVELARIAARLARQLDGE